MKFGKNVSEYMYERIVVNGVFDIVSVSYMLLYVKKKITYIRTSTTTTFTNIRTLFKPKIWTIFQL